MHVVKIYYKISTDENPTTTKIYATKNPHQTTNIYNKVLKHENDKISI